MLLAKNDSVRLKTELIKLRKYNRPLLKLIIDLYHWVEDKYGKDVILTMIFRTQEEQDNLYKGITNSKNIKYDEYPWKSPHQFWHAIDIRSRVYNEDEIEEIVRYLNNKYNATIYYGKTAVVHEVGDYGMHFHIQYYSLII